MPSLLATKLPLIAGFVILVAAVLLHRMFLRVFGVVLVPDGSAGVVTKKFVLWGENATLPDGRLIALKGEAGVQADTLAPGVHFFLWPWQYSVEMVAYVTIPGDKIGVVEARDGTPLPAGRILASQVACDSFQNARAFLENGGERGPQLTVMPPGSYRLNTSLFTVKLADVTAIPDNQVGIVTTKEGTPLPTGDIAGREIPGHNLFQDAQAFVNNGGFKGLQEQVILAGRYYLNPRFVEVELAKMTEVPIGFAGVVISYVGGTGRDRTGDGFKHGNIVGRGERGVWDEPLDPGKYPVNVYTHKLELVPTTNVVLNWATGKNESHNLDKNLSTITVRSSDGFPFNLDVSQIIHVPRNSAPKVIARFGNMANLVTQVLEPTIGNYFRNAAQSSDVIAFLQKRSERQDSAKSTIAAALGDYDVQAVDTLIGDIVPPDALMETLTERKLAQERQTTYQSQQIAEQSRQELNKARALADIQQQVVTAERGVEIAEKHADAAVKKAQGEAESMRIQADGQAKAKVLNASADAQVFREVGAAEAEKIEKMGTAQAKVTELQKTAIGADNFATIEVARAFAQNRIPLVPTIMVNGSGSEGGTGGLMQAFLGSFLKDKLALEAVPATNGAGQAPASPTLPTLGTQAGSTLPVV